MSRLYAVHRAWHMQGCRKIDLAGLGGQDEEPAALVQTVLVRLRVKTGCRDTEANGCDSVTRWLYGEIAPAQCYIPSSPVFRSLREENCYEFKASLSYTDLNHGAYNKLCNHSLGVRGGAAARHCLGKRLILNLALFFLAEEASCSLLGSNLPELPSSLQNVDRTTTLSVGRCEQMGEPAGADGTCLWQGLE